MVEHYPFDYDELKKGDIVSLDRLEDITNMKRGTTQFQLAVLGLRETIMRELADRGKPCTVAQIGGGLKILTDSEAAIYDHKQFQAGYRKQARSLSRQLQVDVRNLDAEEKKEHERNIILNSRLLQSQRDVRRNFIRNGHQRDVPGLPDPGAETDVAEESP